MTATAHQTLSSAAAPAHAPASLPLELLEARQLRDALKLLLRQEQAAMADFLIALADFDRRRGWELLGHASLFAFLVAELGLSTSSTYWRKSAAELLRRFPDLERPLRQGRLCLTTMAELAKVLTQENREAVLPRFFGISSREAKEIVAELQPRETPPLRSLVTSVAQVVLSEPVPTLPVVPSDGPSDGPSEHRTSPRSQVVPASTDSESFRAPEMKTTHPARVAAPRDDVEPLTADLRRLHVTVSRQFLEKLEAARDGLSHAVPGATTEQVIEAALDLLLEKQAKARGQVKRPRKTIDPTAPPTATLTRPSTANLASTSSAAPVLDEPLHRRTGPRETIPAAVRRAVWARDRGRCQWPIDGGGVCGSTHRLELDHVVPWAKWSGPTVANLRLACAHHNGLAARLAFGERFMGRYRGVREPMAAYAAVDRSPARAG